MLYKQTLKELSEDQIAILFVIANNALMPLGVVPNYSHLTLLRQDITLQHIDFLKNHALEESIPIFDDLKAKILEFNK
jgi:hypothetical protein